MVLDLKQRLVSSSVLCALFADIKPLIRFKHFPLNTISPRQHFLISLCGPLVTQVVVLFFLFWQQSVIITRADLF